MKKIKCCFLIILLMIVLVSCDKPNKNQKELNILGVNSDNIKRIEIIHGNIILYPDSLQKDNLTLIDNLNTFFDSSDDEIELIEDNVSLTLADCQGYAQNDSEDYYAYITFSIPQTLDIYHGSENEYPNCDGILFNINDAKIYWFVDGESNGTFGYKLQSITLQNKLSTLLSQVERIFDSLENVK